MKEIITIANYEEKAKIVFGSDSFMGKIFLLGPSEANSYFASNDDRRADATPYAVAQGVKVKGSESGNITSDGTCSEEHCYAFWWLYYWYHTQYVYVVNSDGEVPENSSSGYYVASPVVGVRPVLWINY